MNTSASVLGLVLFCFITGSSCQDAKGQKAHFQVEDKSGELKIHATKDLATVEAQADSVDVVIKPGTAEYPVFKSDKPLVHVESPLGYGHHGWNVMNFKKSQLETTEEKREKISRKNETGKTTKLNMKKTISDNRKQQSLVKNNRHIKPNTDTNSKPKLQGMNKHLTGQNNKNNNVITQKLPKHVITSKLRKIINRKQQSVVETVGNKKSEDTGSKLQVTGKTGHLKVHVDKKITTVTSTTGAMNFEAKNTPAIKPRKKEVNDINQMYHEDEKLLQNRIHIVDWRQYAMGIKKDKLSRKDASQ